MPPLKELGSLRSVCLEYVWQWLHHHLRQQHQAAASDLNQQRQYLHEILPPYYRQQLLNLVLSIKTSKVDIDSKNRFLQLLADGSTQWIDFTCSGSAFIDEMQCFYRALSLSSVINLTRLGAVCDVRALIDRKYVTSVNYTFYWILKKMQNLNWVTLGGITDGTILEILGRNCHQLQHLDVSNSLKVDDRALSALVLEDPCAVEDFSLEQVASQERPTTPCCATLKFVCVSGTQVSRVSIMLLLHYVPNLESFGGHVNTHPISGVVEFLQPEEGVRQFKLTHLWDAKIMPHQASLLSVACPDLTALTTSGSSLPSLHFLQPVPSLAVDLDFKCCVDSIYNYLLSQGKNLKELILSNNINSPLDLGWLMELTPHLEHLEATLCVSQGDEVHMWDFLKVATVTVDSSLTIFALLTHTPDLRDLNLTLVDACSEESYESINDDLVLNIVMAGGLKRLEKLRINQCDMSASGLDYLLHHSPHLNYLAPLICWPNISQVDIDKLQATAARKNWVLKTVMRTDWEVM